MRELLYIIIGLVVLSSCRNSEIKKPDNLISKSKMEDIIYDLALLEAIQSTNPGILTNNHINPYTYVYNKYEIDSVQLAESNKYYALDIKGYGRMYDNVKMRIEGQKIVADSLLVKKDSASDNKSIRDKNAALEKLDSLKPLLKRQIKDIKTKQEVILE
ncbi:MAG: DUF4296 domain-containing protein [Flavobacteriaceae bacterium]|jgi:hypothetical protein|nr:DUF4296 domain-containing protein [Flavobacteriaceae bacterium]